MAQPKPVPMPAPLRGVLLFNLYLRESLTLDCPVNQIGLLLAVFAKGGAGATLAELSDTLGMSQSSTSKNVRALSKIIQRRPGLPPKIIGHDLLRAEVDLEDRKRRRIFTTSRGRELVHVLEACLSGEFTVTSDLPGLGAPSSAYDPIEEGER